MSLLVPFANVFQPLIDVFEQIILFIHDNTGIGWGASIVLLTVAVRLVLLPLTVKQFTSMRRMQQFAPQIKEIQKKYKADKQRQQQEMMRFYQEHKINPFSSCLPLVAQLPVFLGLYYMLRKDLKTNICPGIGRYVTEHHLDLGSFSCHQLPTSAWLHGATPGSEHFLFIPDLTAKATGSVLVILIILYVGTQLSSTLLSPIADRNQRMIMMGLPVVFVVFIIQFPTGLIVYWVTTNAWTAAQQIIIRRKVGPVTPLTAGASGDGGGGGLLAALGLGGEKDGAARSDEGRRENGRARGGGAKEAAPTTQSKRKQRTTTAAKGGGSASAGGGRTRTAPPPRPPRKKKKRSGRRR